MPSWSKVSTVIKTIQNNTIQCKGFNIATKSGLIECLGPPRNVQPSGIKALKNLVLLHICIWGNFESGANFS